MSVDRMTQALLALILVALCALLIRGEITPALAQSRSATTGNPAITFLGPNGTMAYVVSGGMISFWEVDTVNGKPKLVMYDSKAAAVKIIERKMSKRTYNFLLNAVMEPARATCLRRMIGTLSIIP